MDRPYTTISDVITETKSSDNLDDVYALQIELASRYIDDHCNRDFWFHDHAADAYRCVDADVFDDEAYLPWPILTLTEVSVNEEVLELDTQYWFEVGSRSVHFDVLARPAQGRSNVKVKGTFGYTLSASPLTDPPPTLPVGVRRACTLIATAFSAEKRQTQIGLDGSRVDLLDTRIPQEAVSLLAIHCRRVHRLL